MRDKRVTSNSALSRGCEANQRFWNLVRGCERRRVQKCPTTNLTRIAASEGIFLKWIVAHPAVTCVIPATSKPHDMEDDLQAGLGRMPDEKMRRRMMEAMSAM
jgi:aryl-alcohol dehydrogenase-like predicted oxidoreductase